MGAADGAAGFKVFFQSDLDATVPEPTTRAMMLLGFAGLAYAGWRRSVKARPFTRLA
jgi:PEP-CTERM motif